MSLIVKIKVVPSSGKQSCTRDTNGHIKCFLKSPPEKGKANVELIRFLSKQTKIPQQHIKIISGHTYRIKTIHIEADLTLAALCKALNIGNEACKSIFGKA